MQGVNYRYLRPREQLGPHQYNSSSDIFASFLCNRHPFARDFNEALAREFYRDVRCGLLHEARTKGGRKVWAQAPNGRVVDHAQRIVYRNNFQHALDEFISWYNAALPHDVALQEAFIRKFNNLCEWT